MRARRALNRDRGTAREAPLERRGRRAVAASGLALAVHGERGAEESAEHCQRQDKRELQHGGEERGVKSDHKRLNSVQRTRHYEDARVEGREK